MFILKRVRILFLATGVLTTGIALFLGLAAYARQSADDKKLPDKAKPAKAASERERRQLRWVVVFDTKDGDDYAKQLQALGAMLAVPEKSGQEYRLFRDLAKRPLAGKVEDLSKMDRIFWIDDKQDSVRGLAKALGVDPAPEFVVAFLTEKMEKELLRQELAFAGRKEKDIQETRFKVVKAKDGYEVKAVSQR
jgi:hypothetical protein